MSQCSQRFVGVGDDGHAALDLLGGDLGPG